MKRRYFVNEIAGNLGITKKTVYNWINGNTQLPIQLNWAEYNGKWFLSEVDYLNLLDYYEKKKGGVTPQDLSKIYHRIESKLDRIIRRLEDDD